MLHISNPAEGPVRAEVARVGAAVTLQATPSVVRGRQYVQELFERIEVALGYRGEGPAVMTTDNITISGETIDYGPCTRRVHRISVGRPPGTRPAPTKKPPPASRVAAAAEPDRSTAIRHPLGLHVIDRDASTDVEELNRSSTHFVLTPTTPPAATRLRTVTERRPHPAHGERHQLRQFQIGSTRRADSPTVTWQPTVRCHPSCTVDDANKMPRRFPWALPIRPSTRAAKPVDFAVHRIWQSASDSWYLPVRR